jgi:hypothetical protein
LPTLDARTDDKAELRWPELQSVLADCRSLSAERLQLRIATNGDFVEEIIQPVLDRMDQVADTTELFLRAQQLVRLCEAAPRGTKAYRNSALTRSQAASQGDGSERKIGAHVRQTMVELANAGKLTPKIVADLGDGSHSKATLGLNHPFLKQVMPDAAVHAQGIDDKGYNRYWRDPLEVDGAQFLVCSQWFAWQRPAFDRWVRDLKASEAADYDRRLDAVNSATSAAGPIWSLLRFTR